jgi:hypothetical protein
MSRLRFSIASLLGLVLLLAVSLAALRAADELWDSAVFTGTVAILLIAVLLVVHRTDRRRAFWLGFAVFGWVAFVASMAPAVESRLVTTKLLAYLGSKVSRRSESLDAIWDTWSSVSLTKDNVATARVAVSGNLAQTDGWSAWAFPVWDATTGKGLNGARGTTENFLRIGHSLIALMLAWLGGHLSRGLYIANRHPEGSEESRPSASAPG